MTLKSIDADTLKILLDIDEAVVIDVREPGEFAVESIPGAKLIPLASLTKKALESYSHKKIIVHCLMGKRGNKACEKLLVEDPNLQIYNLEGGITAWKNAGYPVQTTQ